MQNLDFDALAEKIAGSPGDEVPSEIIEIFMRLNALFCAVYARGAAQFGDMEQMRADGYFGADGRPTAKLGEIASGTAEYGVETAMPLYMRALSIAEDALEKELRNTPGFHVPSNPSLN